MGMEMRKLPNCEVAFVPVKTIVAKELTSQPLPTPPSPCMHCSSNILEHSGTMVASRQASSVNRSKTPSSLSREHSMSKSVKTSSCRRKLILHTTVRSISSYNEAYLSTSLKSCPSWFDITWLKYFSLAFPPALYMT